MSYKFYLELLRAGLYTEFFEELKTGLVPFMVANHSYFINPPTHQPTHPPYVIVTWSTILTLLVNQTTLTTPNQPTPLLCPYPYQPTLL